jgi:hypothetical protein
MKKILFATQVISLLAILPVVVILEMNHVEPKPQESKPPFNTLNKISVPLSAFVIQ